MEEVIQEFKNIIISSEGGVTTITLNRPEKRNAMSPELMEEFAKALDKLAKDDGTRTVVITGAGEAFCAGGDVKLDVAKVGEYVSDMKSKRKSRMSIMAQAAKHANALMQPIKKIASMEKPVIAAVNGFAVGGGCDLAMVCDIRIASEKAKFGEFYVRRGLVPDLGGTYFLPRLVGISRAKLLTFTGDLIDAKEAERIGLVDEVVPEEKFESTVYDLAKKLAKGPTKAIGAAKREINKALNMTLDESLSAAMSAQLPLIQTEDYKEGYTAFLEKRDPVYKGK